MFDKIKYIIFMFLISCSQVELVEDTCYREDSLIYCGDDVYEDVSYSSDCSVYDDDDYCRAVMNEPDFTR
jgi:hypothetical protein